MLEDRPMAGLLARWACAFDKADPPGQHAEPAQPDKTRAPHHEPIGHAPARIDRAQKTEPNQCKEHQTSKPWAAGQPCPRPTDALENPRIGLADPPLMDQK